MHFVNLLIISCKADTEVKRNKKCEMLLFLLYQVLLIIFFNENILLKMIL